MLIYRAECELDELSVDDVVIDFAYLSDENFLLVVLLTSKGNVQFVYEVGSDRPRRRIVSIPSIWGRPIDPVAVCIGPEAIFLAVALSDGDILIVPMKILLDVVWGSSNLFTESSPVLVPVCSSADLCLRTPTSIISFISRNNPTPIVIYSNKAGQVLIVDLVTRKLTIEVQAPESVHKIDVFFSTYGIDLLVTGFTGVQWIVPLENGDRSIRETLGVLIPSDLKAIQPSTATIMRCGDLIAKLDSETNIAQLFPSIRILSSVKKIDDLTVSSIKLNVPSSTMSLSILRKAMFSLNCNGSIQYKLRFGLDLTDSIEGSEDDWLFVDCGITKEWKSIGLIPLIENTNSMPQCLIVNERGLVRIIPDSSTNTIGWLAESVLYFNYPSPSRLREAGECLSPGSSKVVVQKVLVALLERFSSAKQSYVSSQLAKIVTIAKNEDMSFDDLVDMMEKFKLDHLLLPQILSRIESNGRESSRKKVIQLIVRSVETGYKNVLEADCTLSCFLCRHLDISDGLSSVLNVSLWRSAALLLTRDDKHNGILVAFLLSKGTMLWKNSDNPTRALLLCLIWPIKWDLLETEEISLMISLITEWQVDLIGDTCSLYKCARIAYINMERCESPSQILYVVSSILAASSSSSHSLSIKHDLFTTGVSSSLAYGVDRRLLQWGQLTSSQPKILESEGVVDSSRIGNKTKTPTSNSSTLSLPTSININQIEIHNISVGAEHVIIVSNDGRLFSWGMNRYGQCGLGHCNQVNNPTEIDGEWKNILSLSCGQFHSSILLSDGHSLYTFGWGLYGQLGHSNSIDRSANLYVPTKIDKLPDKMIKVVCGRVHTLVLSESGDVWVVGGGTYGQLGTIHDHMKVFQWNKIDLGNDVRVLLLHTRFYHTIAVTDDNRILEWGKNPQEVKMKMFVMRRVRNANKEGGQKNNKSPLPMTIPKDYLGISEVHHDIKERIICISSGLSHCALITISGSLYTWGKNLDYQLGLGHKNERNEPTKVCQPEGIVWTNVECGGNHTLGSSSDGRIWSWGRNDVNQCGVPIIKGANSPRKYFFQAKEGSKRCVQLADDSTFVSLPTLVPTLTLHQPYCQMNKNELISILSVLDIPSYKLISRMISPISSSSPSSSSSFCIIHLMGGDITSAIHSIKNDHRSPLLSLLWDIISNHEEYHTHDHLSKAFGSLPRTSSTLSNRQLRSLWSSVWDEDGTQNGLNIHNKLNILSNFSPSTSISTHIKIPCSSLSQVDPSSSSSSSSHSRIFPSCLHVVSNSSTTSPSIHSCSICIEEWKSLLGYTLTSFD